MTCSTCILADARSRALQLFALPSTHALPLSIARLSKRYTNRSIEPLLRRWSRFAVVRHVCRRTGTAYRTPVTAFDPDGALVIALTYGPSADWVQNVLAGTAEIESAGVSTDIAGVELVGRDLAWAALPGSVRGALRASRVRKFRAPASLRPSKVSAWPGDSAARASRHPAHSVL